MAKTFNEEDRVALIKQVGDYYIETKDSFRKIAEKFKISSTTAYSYVNEYRNNHKDLRDKIDEINESHRPRTVDDIEVKARVLNAAKLCVKGYTMEEIANAWGVSVDVINDDLHSRLSRIDNVSEYFDGENIIEKVNVSLKEHSATSRKEK